MITAVEQERQTASFHQTGRETSASAWYVIYTHCRHEVRVETGLRRQGLEVFLPLVTVPSRRRDRRLQIQVPLFPGYLFVCSDMQAPVYVKILRHPGVVRILGTKGRLTPVPTEVVESIRTIVTSDRPFYPWPYLEKGQRVIIMDGPLAGASGIIVGRRKKNQRLVVSVELFQRAVAVELDDYAVEPCSPCRVACQARP